MEEPFWSVRIQVLLDREKLNEFIPKKGMSENQIYNSIVRFSMYLSILLVILNNNLNYLGIVILAFLFTYLHKYHLNDTSIIKESVKTKKDITREDFELELENEMCRKPTKDNPFMNRLPTDELTDLKPACHITPTVKENIDTLFNEDLESQMENIYNPLINQRAFHTMPTTTSTYDQKSFRDWLYKSKEQCKLEEDLEISDSVRGCKGIIGFESPCGQGFSNYSSL
jgi:hypothetical protein